MNTIVSPLGAARAPVLNAADYLTASPHRERDVQVYSFDQLKVVEGVYSGEQLKSWDDFILGDVFRFSESHKKYRTDGFAKPGLISIETSTAGNVDLSPISAAVTHTLTYMSETGKLLRGYVLDSSRNAIGRPPVVLCEKTNSASKYTLIDMLEGTKEIEIKMALEKWAA